MRSGATRVPAMLLLLSTLLLLGGCKQAMLKLPDTLVANNLDRWVKQELTPYLIRETGQHPRFQGQRLAVVQMRGDQVVTQMDGLTTGLRDNINTALLSIPGGQLVRQSGNSLISRNRDGTDNGPLQCNLAPDIHYLIGIETRPLDNGEVSVSVRALDLSEQIWVGGFGKRWQGRLTASQKRSLQQLQSDESLRGRRVLPFEADQADFAARELAWQLNCRLLKQQESPTRVYLHPGSEDPFVTTTFKLLENYLARYRQALITRSPKQANLTLSGDLQPIHPQLGQLWISARDNDGTLHSGLNAQIYVRLTSPSAQNSQVGNAAVISARAPASIDHQSAATPALPAAAPEVRSVPLPSARSRRKADNDFMRVLVPEHASQCRSSNPWRRGEHLLTVDEANTEAACFALQLQVPRGYQAFLISKHQNGSLQRLAPDRCRGLVRFVNNRNRTDTLRFPSRHLRGQRSALRPDADPTTYYAVAVKPGRQSQQLRQHLTRLPGACSNRSRTAMSPREQQRWLQRFDQLSRQQPQLIWQATTLRAVQDDHYPVVSHSQRY